MKDLTAAADSVKKAEKPQIVPQGQVEIKQLLAIEEHHDILSEQGHQEHHEEPNRFTSARMDKQAAIAKMKRLLKDQSHSKASKYQAVIRESEEFTKQEIYQLNEQRRTGSKQTQKKGSQNPLYLEMKHDVLSILRKKVDNKKYKEVSKECRKTASKATDKWRLGESVRPLK